MKQGIHPEYKEVVFQDEDAGFAFLTRSTIKTNETIILCNIQNIIYIILY